MSGEATPDPVLPLMRGLRNAPLPTDEPLVLASGSPRRAELLAAAGYPFRVETPEDHAEDLPRPGEPAEAVVQRLAFQKAGNVAERLRRGWIVAADTLGVCDGELLGKPADEADARRMLRLLSGRVHHVLTGICLWDVIGSRRVIDAVRTDLRMGELTNATIESYIRSGRWRGKAGGFGYQDGNDWLHVLEGGSESNVVGLPMERLTHWLERVDHWQPID
jgi:septum formation protein